MTGVRFVAALPRRTGSLPVGRIRIVRALERLCGDVPQLWIADDCPVIDFGPEGRLVGVAFAGASSQHFESYVWREGQSPRAALADLVADAWGAYLALAPDHARGTMAALVDPSGLLPVYRSITPTHVLLASDAVLLHRACGIAPRICGHALGAFLMRPELRQRQTCLQAIDELPPGTLFYPCLEDAGTVPVWRVKDFLPQSHLPSFEEAADQLRKVSRQVLGAWADHFGSIAVATSGGVDSSFIAAALADTGKTFGCVTLATADPSGDERHHARLLAGHLEVPLAERIYDPSRFDPVACASAGLPRPSRRPFMTAIDALLAEGAAGLGKGTVFDGNGGDNLFCFLHSAAPVVDRLRVEGVGRGALATLLDMCRVTGCDVPTLLTATARRFRTLSNPQWPTDRRLLSHDLAPCEAFDPVSPWITVDTGRHRGKRDHLALIMQAQNQAHGLGSGPARFSPLMSQPLLELCLGIPTWLWARGGRNRALARAAFARDLPEALLVRTSKAGPDSFIRGAFALHRGALRERLLGGLLDRHGLLDRGQVERAFALEPAVQGDVIYRLLDLVEAENWARSWSP